MTILIFQSPPVTTTTAGFFGGLVAGWNYVFGR